MGQSSDLEKQETRSGLSSAEAEYRAVAEGICEGISLKRILEELKLEGKQLVKLLCDSQAALNIIRNPVHHDHTKHVELDRHFITEKVTK